jgi:hypothetical protein
MVLIVPPSLIAARRLRPQIVCALGLALVNAAILGLIAVGAGVWFVGLKRLNGLPA